MVVSSDRAAISIERTVVRTVRTRTIVRLHLASLVAAHRVRAGSVAMAQKVQLRLHAIACK